jgi:hypothetical protein
MSGPSTPARSALPPVESTPEATFISLVAAKAGREMLWLAIAAAFFVVEALVFVTELPAAKVFQRRETIKAARHSRQ